MDMHLKRQVEKIADEAEQDRISIIIQMTAPDDELGTLLRTAGEALERRRMSTSPRDLLPPASETMSKAAGRKPTAAAKRKLSETGESIASSIALSAINSVTAKTMMQAGLRALSPLWASALVELALAHTDLPATKLKGASKRKKIAESVSHFWSSSSAVLEVTKDELARLAEEIPEIADIFPNRILNVPPISETKVIPPGAADNKVSAWGLEKTGALACWGAFGARGKGVRVAVLDTGVDPSHPDLEGKISDFAEFDRNGRQIESSQGAYDSGDHGTHCAGTVVGGNQSSRWIGMAPDAQIAAALVLKNGSGSDAQILAGMQWAIDLGVDVISMSLSGLRMTADVMDTYTRTMISAVRLGIPVVVAIGNDGHQTSGTPGNDYFAFCVGATDLDDRAAGFSGGRTQIVQRSRYIDARYLPLVYGKPDVSAPGVAVLSCTPGDKWVSWNGTSMATPHVAGAIALMLSATSIKDVESTQRAFLIQDLLTATVEELGESGQDHRFGFGRIDVLRAIGYAKDLGY